MEEFKKEFIRRYPYLPIKDNTLYFEAISVEQDNGIWYVKDWRKRLHIILLPTEYSSIILDELKKGYDINEHPLVKILDTDLFSKEGFIIENDENYGPYLQNRVFCRKIIQLVDTEEKFWSFLEDIFLNSENVKEFFRLNNNYFLSIIDSERNKTKKLNTLICVLPKVLQTTIDKQLDVLIEHFQYNPESDEVNNVKDHFDSLK